MSNYFRILETSIWKSKRLILLGLKSIKKKNQSKNEEGLKYEDPRHLNNSGGYDHGLSLHSNTQTLFQYTQNNAQALSQKS